MTNSNNDQFRNLLSVAGEVMAITFNKILGACSKVSPSCAGMAASLWHIWGVNGQLSAETEKELREKFENKTDAVMNEYFKKINDAEENIADYEKRGRVRREDDEDYEEKTGGFKDIKDEYIKPYFCNEAEYRRGSNDGYSDAMSNCKDGNMRQIYLRGVFIGNSSRNNSCNDGYKRGVAEGDSAGYLRGFSEGNTTWYNAGLSDGDAAGYKRGVAEGDSAGYLRGFSEGNTTWYNAGISDGLDAGNNTSFPAGYDANNSTCFLDGYSAGNLTGFSDGYSAGNFTGFSDGYSAGNFTGFSDGYDAGKAYGIGLFLGNGTELNSSFTSEKSSEDIEGYRRGLSDGSSTNFSDGNYSDCATWENYGYERGRRDYEHDDAKTIIIHVALASALALSMAYIAYDKFCRPRIGRCINNVRQFVNNIRQSNTEASRDSRIDPFAPIAKSHSRDNIRQSDRVEEGRDLRTNPYASVSKPLLFAEDSDHAAEENNKKEVVSINSYTCIELIEDEDLNHEIKTNNQNMCNAPANKGSGANEDSPISGKHIAPPTAAGGIENSGPATEENDPSHVCSDVYECAELSGGKNFHIANR